MTASEQITDNLVERLRKVLALTTSPVEGEAQAAAEMLQKLLMEHNLGIADLERRGQDAPGVREETHDLGKAAFKWKLTLAEVVAGHYFCHPLVDFKAKTVAFVGRPENVESLQMLYIWLMNQVKHISADERTSHLERTGERIDPLRWQINFGEGAVCRLDQRLQDLRARQSTDAMALVIHHKSEISDYLEAEHGYRVDGQMTARERGWQERYDQKKARKADLKANGDLATLYKEFPEENPVRKAIQAGDWEKWQADQEKRSRAREKRQDYYERTHGYTGRRGRTYTAEEYERDCQAGRARDAGDTAAGRINLQPFITGQAPQPTAGELE